MDNTNSTHTRAQNLIGFIKGIMGNVQGGSVTKQNRYLKKIKLHLDNKILVTFTTFNWLFCICPDIILQVNRTAQNETKVTDEKDLTGKIAEVQSMLRDMRFRGFDFQRRLAGNELEQANKCE